MWVLPLTLPEQSGYGIYYNFSWMIGNIKEFYLLNTVTNIWY